MTFRTVGGIAMGAILAGGIGLLAYHVQNNHVFVWSLAYAFLAFLAFGWMVASSVMQPAPALAVGRHGLNDPLAVAMADLSISIMEVARQAEAARSATWEAAEVALSGPRVERETSDAMEAVRVSTLLMVKAILVIRYLAGQASLLSFNAALEGAKSGAHNKGFAAVGEDVRKLAERSRTAAREIEDLVTRSLRVGDHGERRLSAVVDLLEGLRIEAERTAQTTLLVAQSSKEQARAVEEVGRFAAILADDLT